MRIAEERLFEKYSNRPSRQLSDKQTFSEIVVVPMPIRILGGSSPGAILYRIGSPW